MSEIIEQKTKMYCDICGEDISTQNIQTETKHGVDVAYVICQDTECGNRYNLMFSTNETDKLSDKIKVVKEIEEYLQLQLYLEMLKAEDKYYAAQYELLPKEDKDRIGGYTKNVTKEKVKEYQQAIKDKKYSVKDLLKLL